MDAFAANPDSEQVWLAAVKLEWENDERDRARVLLTKARDRAPSPRVWMKAALLERECGDYDAELRLLDEALTKYATFAKFYLMAGQACERPPGGDGAGADARTDGRLGAPGAARDFYQRGLRRCPKSAPLWIAAAALEERDVGATKARSILELARLKNGKNADLWLAAVRLERRHGNRKLGENLSAKALQECPESGELWADEIANAPRPARKGKSLEALKRCDNNAHVIVAVSRLFVAERKHAKARKWFNRACALDPDLGDAWAAYYAFELVDGAEPEQEDVASRCAAAEPAHGELWTSVSKDPRHARLDVVARLKLAAARIRAADEDL
jgi:pre-mRNA-processing factor 6